MPVRQPLPEIDLQRFSQVAEIHDKDGFLTVLRDLLAENAANGPKRGPSAEMAARGKSFEMAEPYQFSDSAVVRGRRLQLRDYLQKSNLPIAQYAELVGKGRQNVYRDIEARRLLGIALEGRNGIRVPDWQLQPAALALTQAVLQTARDVDSWTLYKALSTPADGFEGRAPVADVTPDKVKAYADLICSRLGVFG